MKEKKIVITVSGTAGSGKSRLSFLLKKFVQEQGFDVTHEITSDYRNQTQFETQMNKNLDVAIENLKERTEILIKEQQLNRKIKP